MLLRVCSADPHCLVVLNLAVPLFRPYWLTASPAVEYHSSRLHRRLIFAGILFISRIFGNIFSIEKTGQIMRLPSINLLIKDWWRWLRLAAGDGVYGSANSLCQRILLRKFSTDILFCWGSCSVWDSFSVWDYRWEFFTRLNQISNGKGSSDEILSKQKCVSAKKKQSVTWGLESL